MKSRWLTAASLVAGLALAACGSGDGGSPSASAASNSSKPADSTKVAANDKKSADPKPATSDKPKPADSGAAVASADDALDKALDGASSDGEASGALQVDLSQVKDDAPSIGGGEPPKPATGAPEIKWLPLGSYDMPSMGLDAKAEGSDKLILSVPGEKGGIVITTWKDPKDAGTKETAILKEMALDSVKWGKKPTALTLGADKIPALVFAGHAKKGDKEGELRSVLVKGTPNLLAILALPDAATKETKTKLYSAIAYMRKHK